MAGITKFSKGLLNPSHLRFAQHKFTPGCLAVNNSPNHKQVHVTPLRQSAAAPAAGSGHGTHWIVERVAAGALYGVLPMAYFMQPSFAMDTALTSSLVLHAHWGIAAIFQDYMHGYPGVSGERRYPWLTTLGKIIPYILSITAFACLMNFNYNDVGLARAIGMLWRV